MATYGQDIRGLQVHLISTTFSLDPVYRFAIKPGGVDESVQACGSKCSIKAPGEDFMR